MKINFSPVRCNDDLIIEKAGDSLVVNGEIFDFGAVPEGGTLPDDAIDSVFFCGPVERVNGELHLTVMLPHGPNPSPAVAFPAPIVVTADGPVELPQ